MSKLESLRKFLFDDPELTNRKTSVRFWLAFIYHVGQKSWQDNILQRSAALSFFTLLNFFPLAGILLFVLSHSTLFQQNLVSVENAIIRQLVTPAARQLATDIFTGLSKNLSAMGTGVSAIVTIVILFVLGTSLILLVERSLNEVFRSPEKRGNFLARVAFLWTIMTLLPVTLGFSFALTSHIQRQYADYLPLYRYCLPYIMTLLGFMAIYRVIPRVKIRLRIVFFVSLLFGIFWELAKVGLGRYVDVVFSKSPVHQLYGSMALVPIGMVWIYYSWVIVLIGAEFAYVMQNYEKVEVESRKLWLLGKGFVPLSRRVALAMVLEAFRKFRDGGGGFSVNELTSRFQVHYEQAVSWFEALAEKKIIVITEDDEVIPGKPPASISLKSLSKLYEGLFERLLGNEDIGGGKLKGVSPDTYLNNPEISLEEILERATSCLPEPEKSSD